MRKCDVKTLKFFIFLNALDACGGVINAANGTIQTPGFPAEYPHNKNCIWKIVAAPKSTIFLNFTHFDLEGKNVSLYVNPYYTISIPFRLQFGV